MDAAERALLEATVRDAIARAPETADAALDEIGWREMLQAEPRAAVAIVFEALGTTNGVASALDDVVVSGLGREPRADLAVLLPPFAAWDPPAPIGEELRGLATARVATATELLVGTTIVPISAVDASPMRGVDPDACFYSARVTAPSALDSGTWEDAVALGQRALSHQILGASRAMLDLACTHARERVQFGRPIARFQAVRHRLADALVAVEALAATVDVAADEPNPTTAALAKATAGRTARTVASHCQQVLAGIGFTTEHPFHQFMKRTMLLDGILGSTDELVVDIGRRVLATRAVPTLIEL
jgi:alkylation response protein AidB-like acyl-CoA dehydrogenase